MFLLLYFLSLQPKVKRIVVSILLVFLAGCSSEQMIDQRSAPDATVSIGLNNLWDESFGLASSVSSFEIEVLCDGGYKQVVTTSEFSLPIRNKNCVAQLLSFTRGLGQKYTPLANQGFVNWQPSARAVFACQAETCQAGPNLSVYVVKQLPAPDLTVFAEVRYKFAENVIGNDVVLQQSDINFNKVVVGDEPPPFTLRAAYENSADKLELMVECDEFQIGGDFSDAICGTTALNSLRVGIVPWLGSSPTSAELAEAFASSSELLANIDSAILLGHGDFGIGRGGVTVALPAANEDQYLFILSTSGSDSYTYHKLVRGEAKQLYTIGGTISGFDVSEFTLSLNGVDETFVKQDGLFAFSAKLEDLSSYDVELKSIDAVCGIANGEGFVSGADVTDIKITCQSENEAVEDSEVELINPFVTVWKTDNPGRSEENQIRLPLTAAGNYDFIVDWGDGTSDRIDDWESPKKVHTYAEAGTYEVKIYGRFVGWSFYHDLVLIDFKRSDSLKLLQIKRWGAMGLGESWGHFYFAIYLEITATDAPDLTGVTSLRFSFAHCYALTTVPGMMNWSMSDVTDMASLFENSINFNQAIGEWDTSNVVDMSRMFYTLHYKGSKFNQDIGRWNTSNVTTMEKMFYTSELSETSEFNQNIGGWDTSNVSNMNSMFFGAKKFNQAIGSWDVSQVTDMGTMFCSATAFNQEIGGWDTSAVVNMGGMFLRTTFNQDIALWNVSQVTRMGQMFAESAFNHPIGDWDTSQVSDFFRMFYAAHNFNQDISEWNIQSSTDFTWMFRASGFDQDISNWDIYDLTKGKSLLDSSSLSQENYDKALARWTQLANEVD